MIKITLTAQAVFDIEIAVDTLDICDTEGVVKEKAEHQLCRNLIKKPPLPAALFKSYLI
jgi:hypothetical protein